MSTKFPGIPSVPAGPAPLHNFLAQVKQTLELLTGQIGAAAVQLPTYSKSALPSPVAGLAAFVADEMQPTQLANGRAAATRGGTGTLVVADGTKWNIFYGLRGMQSFGQVDISTSTTLGPEHAGCLICVNTAGITLTFQSNQLTFCINNNSSGNVTLAFPVASDYKTVMAPGDKVILVGDRQGGTFRTIAATGGPAFGTFANRPASPVNGQRYVVSDSTTATFAAVVAGGGVNVVPAYWDSANWRAG